MKKQFTYPVLRLLSMEKIIMTESSIINGSGKDTGLIDDNGNSVAETAARLVAPGGVNQVIAGVADQK